MESVQVAFASQALGESDFCGDQVGFWVRDSFATLCVVDGLGHGPEAERAAKAIVNYVGQNLDASPQILFAGADEAARDTRGAAMGLVYVDLEKQLLTHVGVGNTRALLLERKARKPKILFSTNGIVGAGYQKLKPETVSFEPDDLLFLYTDGFPTHVDVAHLIGREGNLDDVATEFLLKSALGTDDAAVLIAGLGSPR
jgi:serine/threonine protein phosphatase PrpC